MVNKSRTAIQAVRTPEIASLWTYCLHTSCRRLLLEQFEWSEDLLRFFFCQSECDTNPRRLLPRPGKVATLGRMLVDDLLILRDGGVEVALQEVHFTERTAGPEILAIARGLDQRKDFGG
jgi:hypothetical protein